jgi:5'-3' exonuclease
LNGKRHEWQAVLLLPFVNEQHVLDALKSVYHLLNDDEKCRNVLGNDQIFFGPRHHLYSLVDSAIYSNIDKHYLSLIDRMSDRKSTSIGIYRPKQRIIEEKVSDI